MGQPFQGVGELLQIPDPSSCGRVAARLPLPAFTRGERTLREAQRVRGRNAAFTLAPQPPTRTPAASPRRGETRSWVTVITLKGLPSMGSQTRDATLPARARAEGPNGRGQGLRWSRVPAGSARAWAECPLPRPRARRRLRHAAEWRVALSSSAGGLRRRSGPRCPCSVLDSMFPRTPPPAPTTARVSSIW
jgi:hypothetical protein